MIPKREHARNNEQAYFVTPLTWERRPLFRSQTWGELFLDVLRQHRGSSYLLHEFVVMPEHFHLLLTPLGALERSLQLIKGGFSVRVKKELGSNAEVWQRGFSDHRIRDWEDYLLYRDYILRNPVKRGSCSTVKDYPFCSSGGDWDAVPQRLKPLRGMETLRHG